MVSSASVNDTAVTAISEDGANRSHFCRSLQILMDRLVLRLQGSIPSVTITVFLIWRQRTATMLSLWARNTTTVVVQYFLQAGCPYCRPTNKQTAGKFCVDNVFMVGLWSRNSNVLAKSVCDNVTIMALQKHAILHASFKNRLYMRYHLAGHQIMNWW